MDIFGPLLLYLLYGLECQLLKKKDTENLEKFQRKCLKQIQGLLDDTSTPYGNGAKGTW